MGIDFLTAMIEELALTRVSFLMASFAARLTFEPGKGWVTFTLFVTVLSTSSMLERMRC